MMEKTSRQLCLKAFILLSCFAARGDTKYFISASPNPAASGSSVTLTCTPSSGTLRHVAWIYNRTPQRVFALSAVSPEPACQIESVAPPGFSFSCHRTSFTLTIDSVTCTQYQGNWQCDELLLGGELSDNEHLIVSAPASNVAVTFDPPTIQQGENVDVNCSAISCSVITNFNLYVDGVKVNTPGVPGSPQVLYSGIKSSIRWTVKAGQSVRCEADGVNTTGPFPLV